MDITEGFVSCVSEDTISCIANAINCLNEEPVDFETKLDILLEKEKFSNEPTSFETELEVSQQQENVFGEQNITNLDVLPITRKDNISFCRLCAGTICDPIYIFSDSGIELELAKKINTCLPVTFKMAESVCSKCSKSVEIEEKSVLKCDGFCSKTFHISCVCIGIHEYTKITDLCGIVKWFCVDCNKRLEDLKPLVSEISAECNELICGISDFPENLTKNIFHKVKTTDSLPKQLCQSCMCTLNTCYKFSESCLLAEKDLNIYGQHSQSSASMIDNRLSANEENSDLPCPLCPKGTMQKCSPTSQEKNCDLHDNSILQKPVAGSQGKESNNQANDKTDTEFIDINLLLDKCKPESSTSEKNIFVCHLCGKCLLTIQQCLDHSKLHSTEFNFPCILCDTKLKSEVELEQHLKVHKVESTEDVMVTKSQVYYKCNECNQGFYSRQKYVQHLQIHDGSKQFYCDICDILFVTEPELFEHVCQFHCNPIAETCNKCKKTVNSIDTHQCEKKDRTNLKCKQCMKIFPDKNSFKIHMTEHKLASHNKHKCDYCDNIFTQKLKLTHHLTKVHGITKNSTKQDFNQCIICEAIFLDVKDAKVHTGTHLPGFEPDFSKVKIVSVSKIYTCEYCEIYFEFPNGVNAHRAQHSGITPYICTVCQETFQTFTQMQVHKKTHEKNLESDSVECVVPSAYVCGICDKDFKIWESLYVHRSRYHNGATTVSQYNLFNLNCHICGEPCENKTELDIHKKQSHKSGEFRCEDCGKILAHLTGLIIHRRQHTGEKPFSCDVCGKKFHQSAGMYTHRRTHTKEYPYRCEICNHGFNVKGDLNNHRRSKHTGERPFKCSICNKAFLTSGVFYQHKMLHAGIKKYRCQFCGGAFSRWNALRLHIRTHTGEKPHSCDICGRGFAQKGDMKKHYRSQHGPRDRRFYCEVCGEGFVRKADMKKHHESNHNMEVM